MGVETIGVLASPNKDVLMVSTLIHRSLDKLVLNARHLEFPERMDFASTRARKLYQSPEIRLLPNSDAIQLSLTIRGHSRMLTVFFTCDTDHLDLGSSSISMSMSSHGHSDIIVQAVLFALSPLGKVYYLHADCSDEPFIKLAAPLLNFAGALSLGFVTAYQYCKWARRHLEGNGPLVGDFEALFGCTPDWFTLNDQLQDNAHAWSLLLSHVSQDFVLPNFWPKELSDYGDVSSSALRDLQQIEAG
jgi:hypothetical protein